MSSLLRAALSVTRTKRRRFLWCAWWSGAPQEDPFRPPDAWNGGARSEDEACAEAETRAGLSLVRIEGRWAGAWVRVQAGLPPFVARPVRPSGSVPAEERGPRPVDPHATLGVAVGASLDEIKARFRERALVLHPDQGGDAAAFMALKRAYDRLAARRRGR